jgi:two-component system, NarL family, sensor histidine kinase NreB
VIGKHVNVLLSSLDDHIVDPSFRDTLKHSLKQLLDVKFALDESSIVAITDHRGIIQYINDKFCEISKYDREELLGKDHRIINSGHHPKAFMKNLWDTISSGKVWRGEIKNRAKDGSYYWVHTTIVPLLNEKGQPYQYLAIRNEVTQRKKAEEELQHMMTHVLEVQEEERKRFSRELHDGIGQSLFSLLIQMDRLMSEHQLPELQQIRTNVAGVIEDVREMAWELRPSVLDDLGVVPALRTYMENYSDHYGIAVEFDGKLRKRLEPLKETVLYRIVQEALTNIAKYADVSEAKVTVQETESAVEAIVADQGKGFTRSSTTQGVGLFSMEERARSVGGTFSIDSVPGQGTRVTLSIPK